MTEKFICFTTENDVWVNTYVELKYYCKLPGSTYS